MHTYDPADSILYVHVALETVRTRSRPTAGEVAAGPPDGAVASGHDSPSPAFGRPTDQVF